MCGKSGLFFMGKKHKKKNRLPIFGSENWGHLRANVADYADRKNKYAFQI